MQIPLRASGSSEIFPGTPRRPDQTQSHYWPYGQQRVTTDGGCATERRIRGWRGGEKEKGKVERTTEEAYLQPGHTHTHTPATGRE